MHKLWTAPALAVLLFSSTSWAMGSSAWGIFNNLPIGVYQDNECLFASWSSWGDSEADFYMRDVDAGTQWYVNGKASDDNSSFCGIEGITIEPQTHYSSWIGTDAVVMGAEFDIYTKYNMITGGDFESETEATLSPIWHTEGNSAGFGVDVHSLFGWEHSGYNNAWVHGTRGSGWNAITRTVLVGQGQQYYLTGWINASDLVRDGYFGVRGSDGKTIYGQAQFGATHGVYQRMRVTFTAPRTEAVTVFAGFWMPGQDAWIRVDDMWMTLTSAP